VEKNHLYITHDQRGVISMANSGKNTNGSQFFITTAVTQHLDVRHVAFGWTVEGFEVVKKIEQIGTSGGAVSKKVVIVDCGEIKNKDT
jgi:cyclophilin family peptidyl-prolyl cis-trans isomerase